MRSSRTRTKLRIREENQQLDDTSHAGVQHFILKLVDLKFDPQGLRGLVVGFGEGHEAEYLQNHTQAEIFGIDVRSRIPNGIRTNFRPILANAVTLPFKSSSFNFVFYHHVIEHVPDPNGTLAEINRLLIPGGVLYIGTPNRHRLIGYLGAYKISLWRKIRNNLMDYKDRIQGKFRNELGAHAGFSQKELGEMLIPYFAEPDWLTEEYLIYKYRNRIPEIILNILTKPNILLFTAPSIYVICRKP